MAERKKVVSFKWDFTGRKIHFHVLGGGDAVLDLSKVLPANHQRAEFHGWTQKCVDKCAIQRDPTTGKSATAKEKFEVLKACVDHLNAGGEWLMRGVKDLLDRGALYQAVATVRGFDPKVVEAKWRDRQDDVIRQVLTDPLVAAEYTRLTVKGDSSGADALLEEFEGLA